MNDEQFIDMARDSSGSMIYRQRKCIYASDGFIGFGDWGEWQRPRFIPGPYPAGLNKVDRSPSKFRVVEIEGIPVFDPNDIDKGE